MRCIKPLHLAGAQAMPGEDVLRRTGGDAGKAGFAAGKPHVRCNREPEHVVAIHEHAEYAGATDHGNRARFNAGMPAGGFEGSAGRIPQGSATISFRVNSDGRMSNCRVVRSSGDSYVDSIVCDAATRHMRFRPARDPNGRAVGQDLTYTPTWSPNPRW